MEPNHEADAQNPPSSPNDGAAAQVADALFGFMPDKLWRSVKSYFGLRQVLADAIETQTWSKLAAPFPFFTVFATGCYFSDRAASGAIPEISSDFNIMTLGGVKFYGLFILPALVAQAISLTGIRSVSSGASITNRIAKLVQCWAYILGGIQGVMTLVFVAGAIGRTFPMLPGWVGSPLGLAIVIGIPWVLVVAPVALIKFVFRVDASAAAGSFLWALGGMATSVEIARYFHAL